ncbi:hypothetical protein Pint_35093 [Pistacia integerrima]|uniref:Uncharacterized protein n=1 Tax=Pistacia integerrima TaxID=434235 RepID=A0ACC0Y5F4_9ROSI|nr:hypothetical protein Pint_35093 [Pistacia integerrima]
MFNCYLRIFSCPVVFCHLCNTNGYSPQTLSAQKLLNYKPEKSSIWIVERKRERKYCLALLLLYLSFHSHSYIYIWSRVREKKGGLLILILQRMMER